MPRTRIRTTNHRSYSQDCLRQAVSKIIQENLSIRNVAKATGIPRVTLNRYIQKHKNSDGEVNFRPSNEHLKILDWEKETMLVDYLKHASDIQYGLRNIAARKLAYEFASINNVAVPESWHRDKLAGREWLQSMMKRNNLSFRCPESTSLSRATSFNEFNVSKFYNNLKELKQKYNFQPQDVYNLDETSCLTVHKPPKVIAQKGQKAVGHITSAERGTLVTCVAIVGATGKAVPPFLIFPRVNFKEHMMNNAPPGSNGVASLSGWMISDLFLPLLQHFAAHERPNKEKPKLIILDNHESHLSILAIDFARDNGIILLTLPPHCSHRLQPLDVAVFGPFKKIYNQSADTWLVNHPGRAITIYDIAELVGKAYPLAFTPRNIISGFKKCGIEPFDPNNFSAEDFLSSSVTDRPDLIKPSNQVSQSATNRPMVVNLEAPSTSTFTDNVLSQTPSRPLTVKIITPEQIQPFPKALPRKTKNAKQKSSSVVLTSTPEKAKLLEKEAQKKETLKRKVEAQRRKILKCKKPEVKKSKNKLAKKFIDEDSSESEIDLPSCDSDSIDEFEFSDVDKNEDYPYNFETGCFVLVKVFGKTKNIFRYYVLEIKELHEDGFEGKFYKRVLETYKFTATDEEAFIRNNDCALILPGPDRYSSGRFANMISFPVNLTNYSPLF